MALSGTCAPGFDRLRAAFEANFTERGEVGAAIAVTVGGETVVDLWGGYADAGRGRSWQADTLVNVYSTTKGMTALCAHLLVDRGELDLDAPVARYWPEFAQAGKGEIPVRWLLSHRAGLIAPHEPLAETEVRDWDTMCARLAATEPWWEPGAAQGYHAVTFGFLVGEVVRRISGRTLGSFLREEITEPLGADLYVGTPLEQQHRCADMIGMLDRSVLERMFPDRPSEPIRSIDQHPLAALFAALTYAPPGDVNSAEYRSAEVPAANAQATARGLATVYGALANGKLVGEQTMEAMRTKQSRPGERDFVIRPLAGAGVPTSWGLGYMLNGAGQAGPNPRAFGHGGAGGSYAFADPENRVSYAYTMNVFGGGTSGQDPRSIGLVRALYADLGIG
ncbi:serine hydrolase domain-containing protein [Sciscionella marina]|uniref:serine hydrolase domain-containing protein n=1 Tax=Sciscionella marina TaxID=508770 RepID=UPI00036A0CFD|nr:serine hydrolase domain-containing protein [Sciscionella marina]